MKGGARGWERERDWQKSSCKGGGGGGGCQLLFAQPMNNYQVVWPDFFSRFGMDNCVGRCSIYRILGVDRYSASSPTHNGDVFHPPPPLPMCPQLDVFSTKVSPRTVSPGVQQNSLLRTCLNCGACQQSCLVKTMEKSNKKCRSYSCSHTSDRVHREPRTPRTHWTVGPVTHRTSHTLDRLHIGLVANQTGHMSDGSHIGPVAHRTGRTSD